MDFEPCWRAHLDVDLDGLSVPFMGVQDLIANKRATARPQDLVDVQSLEECTER